MRPLNRRWPLNGGPVNGGLTVLLLLLQAQENFILCISFLQQRTPKFISWLRMQKNQVTSDGRQAIIDNYIYPLSTLPEAKMKSTAVVFLIETLIIRGNNSYKQGWVFGQRCNGCQEPTISQTSLYDIAWTCTCFEQNWVICNFLKKSMHLCIPNMSIFPIIVGFT